MSAPINILIRKASYLGDYVIRIAFSDGRVVDMDFHPVLSDPGENPMVKQFLDITRFKEFKVVDKQDIVWGDHEMGFPFETLYAGDFRVHWDGKRYPGPSKLKAGKVHRTRVGAPSKTSAASIR